MNEFFPDASSCPGDTLKEVMETKEMTSLHLAHLMGKSEDFIQNILAGVEPVTHDISAHLEAIFGISQKFWNSLETSYRKNTASKS